MNTEKLNKYLLELIKYADDQQRTSEDSYGNYDDVFNDGYRQAMSDVGNEIKELLKNEHRRTL